MQSVSFQGGVSGQSAAGHVVVANKLEVGNAVMKNLMQIFMSVLEI